MLGTHDGQRRRPGPRTPGWAAFHRSGVAPDGAEAEMTPFDLITGAVVLLSAGYFVYRSFRKTAGGCHCDGSCRTRTTPDEVTNTRPPTRTKHLDGFEET